MDTVCLLLPVHRLLRMLASQDRKKGPSGQVTESATGFLILGSALGPGSTAGHVGPMSTLNTPHRDWHTAKKQSLKR